MLRRLIDMTRARYIAILQERARARSTARWLFRLFSRHISGTQSFRENRHIYINLLVVHNLLVPLIGRLVACSARTRADRRTDGQTDRRTDDYCNPRCACAPRVNKSRLNSGSPNPLRRVDWSRVTPSCIAQWSLCISPPYPEADPA